MNDNTANTLIEFNRAKLKLVELFTSYMGYEDFERTDGLDVIEIGGYFFGIDDIELILTKNVPREVALEWHDSLLYREDGKYINLNSWLMGLRY